MTNKSSDGPMRVVVDGSNIATEGRSNPSLAQLNDAVIGFSAEHPDAIITVVVDATFGHRIDKNEVNDFDAAVAHNELVAPPAGAIGRGDAFVLSIANKISATILSNDSFQEFHGQYPWLFDEGRLVGGKPVPNVGWVFVNRLPVKGPVSRRARSGVSVGEASGRRQPSKLASQPMPVPSSPPPGARASGRQATAHAPEDERSGRPNRRGGKATKDTKEPVQTVSVDATASPAAATQGRGAAVAVNDLLPFLEFVEHHPVGSTVSGVVESYSSHGAYVTIGDLRGYVPLRLMGSPPPRSARDILRLGDEVTLVVSSLAPARRSVDLAVPGAALDDEPQLVEAAAPAPGRRGRKAAATTVPPADEVPAAETPETVAPETVTQSRRRRTAKTSPTDAIAPVPVEPAVPAPAKRSRTKQPPASVETQAPAPVEQPKAAKPARTSGAKQAVAKTSAAKKSAAKKSAPKKSAAETASTPPAKSASKTSKSASKAASKPSKSASKVPAPAKAQAPAKAPAKRAAKRATGGDGGADS